MRFDIELANGHTLRVYGERERDRVRAALGEWEDDTSSPYRIRDIRTPKVYSARGLNSELASEREKKRKAERRELAKRLLEKETLTPADRRQLQEILGT